MKMIKNLQKLNSDFGGILEKLCRLSDSCGYRIYLVGGVVRDLFLGKKIFDLDIVIEADAIRFAQIFAQQNNKEFKKHHAFGTATVYFDSHHIDFVTARRETYRCWGALPKVELALLSDDLMRRDFTINAMALSLNKSDYGKLIDFYGGLADLKKGLIKVLHKDSFLEDPTRILRAVRFEQRFGFKIEEETLLWLKEAVAAGALNLVNPHRLREELIPMLKEQYPLRYIKRADELRIFSFIDKKFRLSGSDFRLIRKIEQALNFYKKKFKSHRQLEEWLIYLSALLAKLTYRDILKFLDSFGLRKGERMRILSIYKNNTRMMRLDKKLRPDIIYRILNPLSFEGIIFFYAYCRGRKLRKNIELFLNVLVNTRLQIKGQDLKNLGYKPNSLYGKILEKLLYAKMEKKFKTKNEELKEAKLIFERLSKNIN